MLSRDSFNFRNSTSINRYRPSKLFCGAAARSLKAVSHAICAGAKGRTPSPAKFTRKQRERIVSSIRCGSVVSRIKIELAGGSSRVFKNALAAFSFIRSAATMPATLYSASVGLRLIACIKSRICSMTMTRDFDSGRTQRTSA